MYIISQLTLSSSVLKGLDPIAESKRWLNEAKIIYADQKYFNAAVLSTVDGHRPSSRIILVKEIIDEGYLFYTNYESRKAFEIEKNRFASLLFFWERLGVQLRIEGSIEKADKSYSDRYWAERTVEGRAASIASKQSSELNSYEELIERYESVLQRPEALTRPSWGGYLLKPDIIEFWQEGEHRLHRRDVFRKDETGEWRHYLLSP